MMRDIIIPNFKNGSPQASYKVIWLRFKDCSQYKVTGNTSSLHMPAEIMAAELCKGGKVHKVLDIAAGHGIFGISAAKQNPAAHIYAADWKTVLEVASKNARAMGVADRYYLLPGSAFETDFGSGYDLVLITNFLHHFRSAHLHHFHAQGVCRAKTRRPRGNCWTRSQS